MAVEPSSPLQEDRFPGLGEGRAGGKACGGFSISLFVVKDPVGRDYRPLRMGT